MYSYVDISVKRAKTKKSNLDIANRLRISIMEYNSLIVSIMTLILYTFDSACFGFCA